MNYRKIEKVVKGFANHRRINILYLLKQEPELSVSDISKKLKINFRTTSDHIGKLARAGLLIKRYDNNSVRMKLTNLGKSILAFCGKLE